MCGIAGLVTPPGERPDEGLLERLGAVLRHRGPDAGGTLVDGNVGLAHRRLSIIDTREVANQPLWNEDRTVAVIVNGELYNFQVLRAELEARGHRFATRSDCEVLVHGWEEWGEAVVERLRGMYAFVLWDARRRRLLLGRDRLGKKPLYLAQGPWGFAFASEIKALLAIPGLSRELDLAAIGQFAVYGNTVGERSVYRAIRRLPPGSVLALDCDPAPLAPVVRRYYRFVPRRSPGLDREAFLAELEDTLAEAVRLRLIADVPLGAFLSGGIDSSLVVALMARQAKAPVRTFTIAFDEEAWDESTHARAVAEHLGTDHHQERVTADAAALLPELVATYDEPFGDPSAIPTWYLARMTRRHVTVALSGDGGDELFFGYRRYQETATLDRWGSRLTPLGRAAAAGAARALPRDSWVGRGLHRAAHRGFDLYHHALGFSPVYLSLLTPAAREALGEGRNQPSAEDFARCPDLPLADRFRLVDLGNYLPDQVLVKVDRAAMRHSLEVRCPLLDQEVAALAARAPSAPQMACGGKVWLRELAFRLLPRPLLDRPKQGFAVPLREWFRGPLAPLLAEALAEESNPTWRYFDRTEVARRFARHRSGRAHNETALWRVLFFDRWARAGGCYPPSP